MGRPKKPSIDKSASVGSPSTETLNKDHTKSVAKKKNTNIPKGKAKKCKRECKESKVGPSNNASSSSVTESNSTKKPKIDKNVKRAGDTKPKPKAKKRTKVENTCDQVDNDKPQKEEATAIDEVSSQKQGKDKEKSVTKKPKPRSRCTDLKRGTSTPSVPQGNQGQGESLTERDRSLRSGNSLMQSVTSPRRCSRQLREARLLEDRTIGYHAWSLWSSDQRRPYQQENPDASAEAVDARLRKIWENIGEKDRIKYYLRAVRAHQRGIGYHRNEQGRAWNKSKDTLATSLDLDTFCASPRARQETMVSNSIAHLQRTLPQPYFQQMTRTLHCPHGSYCQINHNPFAQHYPGHYYRTCCSDQTSRSSQVASNTIWERLTSEERGSREVNVEYYRLRIAQNHRACNHVISRAIQEPPESGDWFTDESTWLEQLLDDLDTIEKNSQNTAHNDKHFGTCREGHDMIAQIAAELEASTSHVFHLGKDSVRVPAILNTAEEISVMADAVTLNTIQPLAAEEVNSFFDNHAALAHNTEVSSIDINLNDVLDLLQKALQPRKICYV